MLANGDEIQIGKFRLVALIDPLNAAAVRVACKAGFEYERDAIRPNGRALRLYASCSGRKLDPVRQAPP